MNSKIGLVALVAGFCLSACSHGMRAPKSAAVGYAPRGSSGHAPGAFGASADAAPAASPSESRAEAEGSPPGLGTSWGESIDSRVSRTSFVRENRGSPSAVASFFYNDEEGVAALSHGRFVDYRESVTPIAGGAVRVSLVDSNGNALRAASVDGRTIAVGSEGDRYVIRVENRSSLRLEAVATVDGLDVLDGEDGDFKKRGYVISPYDTLEIEGFRESSGSVRAFRFGATDESYASLRGKDRNVGVVGVAIFREQGSWGPGYTEEELERRQSADPFPGHYAPAPPPSWRGL